MNKIKKCDLCGESKFTFLFEGYDRKHGVPGLFNVYKCDNCGLVFINPQPNQEEITRYYPKDEYYSLQRIGTRPKHIHWRSKLWKILCGPASRTMKVVRNGKLLDIGCGSGEFLLKMKSRGMECYGIEPYDFDAEFAKRHSLKIFHGHLSDAEFPDEYFDVITLNHVFEHVHNPSETLQETHRILKTGGSLIIAVPNVSSWAFKLFWNYWVNLDVPRHLFSYSDITLKRYAEKTKFKIVKTRYNSDSLGFSGSLLYLMNRYRKREILLEERNVYMFSFLNIILLPFAYLSNRFKCGDCIEILLTK